LATPPSQVRTPNPRSTRSGVRACRACCSERCRCRPDRGLHHRRPAGLADARSRSPVRGQPGRRVALRPGRAAARRRCCRWPWP